MDLRCGLQMELWMGKILEISFWVLSFLFSNDFVDWFLVYAKTGETAKDVSLFIVEREFEGFSLGSKVEDKCGMRASMTAELIFDNCVVPKENLGFFQYFLKHFLFLTFHF